MTRAVVIAARRSAVVPRNGAFRALSLQELARPVIGAVLRDAGTRADAVGELVLSNALGAGGNPARLVALDAGLSQRVAGLSIDRQCGGGLDALLLAQALIRAGQHEIVLAGGVESYSRRPLRLRTFADGRAPQPYDQPPFTPWPDRDPGMAQAADDLARALSITRADQESWAIASHAAAIARRAQGPLPEIVAIAGQGADPFARRLSPALCARAQVLAGSVTAATTAVAADAAAFCLVVSDRVAARLAGGGSGEGVEIVAGQSLGADPCLPGLAPVAAIRELLQATATPVARLAQAEIMEAFAAQAIACQRESGLPRAIVNPQGGALARGHPIGASGTVLAVRLFHALRRGGGTGLAAIAAAGGIGTALLMRG